ncbi:MAG: hypothetical protein JO306_00745 [Gemmatimonadetes bacterium]|nr:hypothetical protein [Gemmatimonadota bacterium]
MKQSPEVAAAQVLRTALPGQVSIHPDEDESSFRIDMGDGGGFAVRLLPWSEDAPPTTGAEQGAPTIVWVLHDPPRYLHDELRRLGQSFVDVRGAVHLSLPSLIIDRVIEKLGFPTALALPNDPFSDRASMVLRTLIHGGTERVWGVRELANASRVSAATVTRTVRSLRQRNLVDTHRHGRSLDVSLPDAYALFEAWTAAYDWTRNASLAVNAPMGDPLRFLRRVREDFSTRRMALTLQAGAAIVAPHAAWERAHVYLDVDDAADLVALAHAQGWTPAEDGRLVLLKPYYRDAVWRGVRTLDELPVVTDLQLALDLWRYPLRGREQAEHLIETGEVLR